MSVQAIRKLRKAEEEMIFDRDGRTCRSCGRQYPPHWEIKRTRGQRFRITEETNFLVVDHIIPASQGGTQEPSNLQTLCFRCNALKGGRSAQTFGVMRLIQLLGRPVVSYPFLTRIIGLNASVLIAQLIYWTPRTNKFNEGWIYKTSDQLLEETGLSYKEQATAREKLVDFGLLEEQYDRENHRMDFRVIPDAIEHLTQEHMPEEHMPEEVLAAPLQDDGTLPKSSSYKEREITVEITTESTASDDAPPATTEPDNHESWSAYQERLRLAEKRTEEKAARKGSRRTGFRRREEPRVESKPKRSTAEERRAAAERACEIFDHPERLPESLRPVLPARGSR